MREKLCGRDLPDELSGLQKLRHLNISNNLFKFIPLFAAQLTHLESLNAEHNRIKVIDDRFGQLANLAVRNYTYNSIEKELMLGWNQLARLPQELSNLRSLRRLHLNNNAIVEVSSDCKQLLIAVTHRKFRYWLQSKNWIFGRMSC